VDETGLMNVLPSEVAKRLRGSGCTVGRRSSVSGLEVADCVHNVFYHCLCRISEGGDKHNNIT
jgi:hypothetical protein